MFRLVYDLIMCDCTWPISARGFIRYVGDKACGLPQSFLRYVLLALRRFLHVQGQRRKNVRRLSVGFRCLLRVPTIRRALARVRCMVSQRWCRRRGRHRRGTRRLIINKALRLPTVFFRKLIFSRRFMWNDMNDVVVAVIVPLLRYGG